MSHDFEGKVAIVTGAAGGIGRASAVAFGKKGASVLAVDLPAKERQLAATAQLVSSAGGNAHVAQVDITQEAEVQNMVQLAVERFGRIDFAHNNAGTIRPPIAFHESTTDDWNAILAVNLTGTYFCLKHEIAQLLRQGSGGSLVNTASAAGLVGTPGVATYSASKHGVNGLTKSVALDYAKVGIRVNAVCAGTVATDMARDFVGGDPEELMKEMQPVGRVGRPEEIGEFVAYLCSDHAAYITGQAIAVDGGYTTQ